MPSRYRPLYLIEHDCDFWSRLRRFISLGLTPRAKHIRDQMSSRTAFPVDAWGGEGLRYDMAKAVGEIIRDEIGWPNAHFQPEDPMKLVLFNFSNDGRSIDQMEVEAAWVRFRDCLI